MLASPSQGAPAAAAAESSPTRVMSSMTSQVMEDDLRVEEVTGMTPAPDSSQQELPSTEQISLKPPQALFKPIEYPPLHIFVSALDTVDLIYANINLPLVLINFVLPSYESFTVVARDSEYQETKNTTSRTNHKMTK